MAAIDICLSVLDDIKLMQLATSMDNYPWLCHVWYVRDDENNIYWISRKTRRHSLEIDKNPNVACTFHKYFDGGLMEDKGQALILSGTAECLVGDSCKPAYALYAKRYPKILDFQSEDEFVLGSGHHYFYKLTPKSAIWWDEVNFPENPRQKIEF